MIGLNYKMNTGKPWVIRNDDVLIVNPITGSMKNCLRSGNTFFDWFKLTDKIFEEHNLHCVLSVLAEGVDVYPKWVEYINERKHRYKIEMHGWDHSYPQGMTPEEGYQILSRAREKIEKAFDIEVRHWYVPNGRLFFPEWGPEVCDKLGIQFNSKGDLRDYYQVHLHYWNTRDIKRLQRIIQEGRYVYPVTQDTDFRYGIELTEADRGVA